MDYDHAATLVRVAELRESFVDLYNGFEAVYRTLQDENDRLRRSMEILEARLEERRIIGTVVPITVAEGESPPDHLDWNQKLTDRICRCGKTFKGTNRKRLCPECFSEAVRNRTIRAIEASRKARAAIAQRLKDQV